MKFNFRKIASAMASTVMVGSTVALAAAASYPAPFVDGGAADVAVVYGSSLDMAAVTDVTASLSSAFAAQGSTGVPTGGDFVKLDKSSNKLNLGNTLSGPFGTTVNEEDLENLLADGVYTADDSDTFDYEQKILLGTPTLTHFRDSDFEDLMGYDERTPSVGFKISSGTFVMNYTLDFLDNVLSDIDGGDLDDIEGSDMPLFGSNYYVSDAKNGTAVVGNIGKMTLLDSASTHMIDEGESVNVVVDGNTYEISATIYSATEVVFDINGESTNTLNEGETFKVNGDYLGVRDILYVSKDTGTSSVDFSMGSGKIELEHKSDVKLNDDTISGLKAYLYAGSSSGTSTVIDKIAFEWKVDDEEFLAPGAELVMPGFETVKLSMNDFVRPEEEVITFENDGDTSMELSMPIKDGTASLNLVYANTTTGLIQGLGKASDDRLATSHNGTLWFFEKRAGSEFHTRFVASYNSSTEGESYVLDMNVQEDTGDNRNETTIKNVITGEEWTERVTGDVFDIGDVSFTINTLEANSTDQWAVITGGSGVTFNTVYTPGGLRVYLPFEVGRNATYGELGYDGDGYLPGTSDTADVNMPGALNLTAISEDSSTGHNADSWYLFLDGEDKDDTLAGGVEFNMTVDATSTGELQVNNVNNGGSGGPTGLEVGDSSNAYEAYIVDDVAPRTMHYTDPDQDRATAFYPSGDSESYAEVFLSDMSASAAAELGDISVLDTELAASGMSGSNLVVVGGSCVNSVASNLLGGAGCGDSWTAATGAGEGQSVVETFSQTNGKVATMVAGWAQEDTAAAATFLTTQADVSTDAGSKYIDGALVA